MTALDELMDPTRDGSYDLADVVTVLRGRVADAEDRAARATAQALHAQRTVEELRGHVTALQAALKAIEVPADATG